MQIEKPQQQSLKDAYRKLNEGQTQQAIVDLKELILHIDHSDPMYGETLLILGDAERMVGEFDNAYLHILEAFQIDSGLQNNIPIETVFTCFARLTIVPPDCTLVDEHIRRYLDHPMTINRMIDGVVKCYLLRRLGIEQGLNSTIEMDQLCSDFTLHSAISRLLLSNRNLELALLVIRRALLILSVEGNLSPSHLGLISAFGERALLNEYINPLNDDERAYIDSMVLSLKGLDLESLDDCKYDLMILAMYMPFHKLPSADHLKALQCGQWPVAIQKIAWCTLYEQVLEQETAAKIPSLLNSCSTTSENRISKIVRHQYEDSPYPRWDNLGLLKNKKTYSEHYKLLKSHPLFRGKVTFDLLVAGCGTGEHPLQNAAAIKNLNITAIDLSRQSLAYAEIKRRKLNLRQVTFYQADILELDQYAKSFDIIESVGVLHHMEDPELGLVKLLGCLKPNGVLQLGLYSQLARTRFEGIRKINHSIVNADSSENLDANRVIKLRNDMLVSEEPSLDWTDHAIDFYSFSGFRDLLFNVQEHQYTIAMIQLMLHRFKLKFLGFNLAPRVIAKYQALYPDDKHCTDLSTWAEFEENFPDTFLGMYNFHCSKTT